MEFHLGKTISLTRGARNTFKLPAADLMTHAFICGSTGSGKTVLGKAILEEATRNGIPSIVVDLKGDLASLAVPLMDLSPEELSPWIDAPDEDTRTETARKVVSSMKKGLQSSGYGLEDVQAFRRKIDVKLYTPRSSHGIPVSISLLSPPQDISSLFEEEPETAIAAVKNATDAVFDRLYSKGSQDSGERMVERCFVEELITLLWKQGQQSRGIEAIKELVALMVDPPLKKIGAMDVDHFMPPEMRLSLARRLNALALGSEKLWYEGITLNDLVAETLNASNQGTSRVSVLYLGALDTFADRSLVVSQLGYAIHSQLRRKPGAQSPRVMLYLDEIGGEAGEAFYPSEPYESISKPAISLLVRQGRAYGCCCILATQNPGDIDYRGLSNCQTWFIGRLQTSQDREIVMQGISRAQLFIDKVDAFLRTAEAGQFAVKLRSGQVEQFQERWLMSYHGVIPSFMLPRIAESCEDKKEYFDARRLADSGKVDQAISAYEKLLSENPEDGRFWLGKGSTLLSAGRVEEAITGLKKAMELLPTDSRAYAAYGKALLLSGSYIEASEILQQGTELTRSDELLLLDLGEALYKSGISDKADIAFSEAIDINYQLPKAWHMRGLIAYDAGNYSQANSFLSKAIDLGGNFDSQFLLSQSLLAAGSFEESIKSFEKAHQMNVNSASSLYGLSLALRAAGKVQDAVNKLNELLEIMPKDIGASCALADIYINLNQPLNAIEVLEPVYESSSDDPEVSSLLGISMLMAKRYSEAVSHLKSALAIDKKRADLWTALAEALIGSNKLSEAEKAAKNGSVLAPSEARSWMTYGRVKSRIAETQPDSKKVDAYKESFSHFMKAGELDPDIAEIWYEAGLILEATDRQYDASDYYRRALEADPEHLDARERKGAIALIMDRPDLAQQSYNFVRNRDSARPDAWLGEAESLKRQRKLDDALSLLHKACDLFPENAEVWRQTGIFFKETKDEDKAAHCLAKAEELRLKEQSESTESSNSGSLSPVPGIES